MCNILVKHYHELRINEDIGFEIACKYPYSCKKGI